MVITRDPEARHSQRRHVSHHADGQDDARDALAAAQGRRGALARDGRARREDAGLHRARRRSAVDVLGERAAPADGRRIPVRRIPAHASRCRSTKARDLRPRGAGRGGLRDRGLHRSGRVARDRRAVRRPHRLLLARRSLSAGARHGDHDAASRRSSRRRSSAVRRWKTSTSATRPSESSFRCSS